MRTRVINSQLICADYEAEYPMVVRGEGAWLFDSEGKRYLDASGCTAAVTHIGHGVNEVASALAEQARTLAVHPTHVFHTPVLEAYLERLCAFAPEGFDRGWTISGGTEAIENAVKLAYQYHRAKGRRTRTKIVGRWGSYHGNSLLALDVGGMRARRSFYTDLMVDHLHLSPCFAWRRPEGQSEGEYEDGLIAEFEAMVAAHPDEIIALVTEPFVGAALGAVGATPTYFERMAEICRAHDILMISDEVMTGFGRTGKNFGCEHFASGLPEGQVHADILACAKGISGGYLPLGAILAHARVTEVLRESGEPFWSGQTYACIPLAAAVGHAVLDYIETHDLVARAATVGARLREDFEGLRELEAVGDVRGAGLFLGIEFVAERASKAPFDPALRFAKRVQGEALRRGLVTYACRGTVELTRGDHMLFAPPLVLEDEDRAFLVTQLREAIAAAHASLSA